MFPGVMHVASRVMTLSLTRVIAIIGVTIREWRNLEELLQERRTIYAGASLYKLHGRGTNLCLC
jgi:hypothetical protein